MQASLQAGSRWVRLREVRRFQRLLGRREKVGRSLLILLGVFCAGCSSAGVRPASSVSHSEVIGASVEGRAITAEILGREGPAFLIFGVIHGNEPAGEQLLELFLGHLRKNPSLYSRRRLVVIPVLNPDGLARKSRYNVRGVDLNRNFPASNFKKSRRNGPYPASEPETKALMKMIRQFRPTRVLAVHSPLLCVNYDGPADSLAAAMARASGYPLKPSIGYPTPGSLGSYAGVDLRLPTITLELPGKLSGEKAWEDLKEALLVFVNH